VRRTIIASRRRETVKGRQIGPFVTRWDVIDAGTRRRLSSHATRQAAMRARDATQPPRRPRGPQLAPTLATLTIRLDRRTLDAYRATGPGYQALMRRDLNAAARRLRSV
jgi:uncharacterized protein (DUF4415 family)